MESGSRIKGWIPEYPSPALLLVIHKNSDIHTDKLTETLKTSQSAIEVLFFIDEENIEKFVERIKFYGCKYIYKFKHI